MKESPVTGHPQTASEQNLLQGARQALQAGHREDAYRFSLEVTQQNQGILEAWLIRGLTAASGEERLLCLSQAIRIDPYQPAARQALYTALNSALRQDPFLAYVNETGQVYFVRNEGYVSLAVPKDRNIPESYPPKRPKSLTRAYRWLAWSIFGLALAGLGGLVFAPLAFLLAAISLGQPIQKPDRVRAWLVVWLSLLVFGLSAVLAWLFEIHLMG